MTGIDLRIDGGLSASSRSVRLMLVGYPAWDAVANVVDARRDGGLGRNKTQLLNFIASTITEALDVLERDGLLTRLPDPADRRAKILTLSKKGTHDLAAAQVARDQVRAVIFGLLTDDEKDSLLKMLQQMREAAQAFDTEDLLNFPG